jgi:integrase
MYSRLSGKSGTRPDGLIEKESPTRQVKKLKFDNKRIRFLTHDEAEALLKSLSGRSRQLHNMALLSLHSGMRAGEIFSLKWGNLDVEHGFIHILDAKGGSRTGHMTEAVKRMFQDMGQDEPNQLVFRDRNGEQIKQMSKSFNRAVDDLGINAGVKDPGQKVLFHTLRHTYASWLVQQGQPLYTVQKLMGHASIAMTERYSHLAPDTLKAAVVNFERNITGQRTNILHLPTK